LAVQRASVPVFGNLEYLISAEFNGLAGIRDGDAGEQPATRVRCQLALALLLP
jgi:hypothetical protein